MLHDIRFSSQRFSKILELVDSKVYRSEISLPPFHYYEFGEPIGPFINALELDKIESIVVTANSAWGGADKNFILRTEFQIPDEWSDASALGLYLPIGIAGDFSHPEALLYIDGGSYAAVDRHHQEVLLQKDLSTQSTHELILHGWTGSLSQGKVPSLWMGETFLVEIDEETRKFTSLARVTLGIAEKLDRNDPIRSHLLTSLNLAFSILDMREPLEGDFYASIPDALQKLQEAISQSGPPQGINIWAAGHAHIDIAWLWTLDQSRQKAGRTFHNVIQLMEKYSEFSFSQSQPQLYEFVHHDFPALFEGIKQKISEGQWEPLGGMWVEADCNIPGGESLVRQLMLGRNYFKQQFGEIADSPVLWLPDVFGFPWSLPQLIKEAGLDYFFSIKLGWSQYNRLPYDSFWWQGLDGTRVLTHFSTARGSGDTFVSTYNATATPDEVLTTWKNFQQKDSGLPGQTPPLLMVYGHGDGGGGPTREMVENLQLMENFPGTPRVRMGKVGDFFQELRNTVGERLPTWNDELYLEYHRGTYSTQAKNKRANRKSEILLHNLEFIASMTSLLDPVYKYPAEDLEKLWKIVCLNQFHDILPGTSIRDVYVESMEQYAEIKRLNQSLLDEALGALAAHYSGELLVINPTSFSRSDLVFIQYALPEGTVFEYEDGEPVGTQLTGDGMLLNLGNISPYGIANLKIGSLKNDSISKSNGNLGLIVKENLLENDFLKVEFNGDGEITSLYSKELDQELITSGSVGNQFQAFEDRPKTPDAWEIDIAYDEKMWLSEPVKSPTIVDRGPLRAAIEFEKTILNSTITQRISLAYNARQLVFDTEVDWRERFVLLKVAFPVQVLSPLATYEIQWGDIQRPTHHNTSWDWAKFEVPAQKWVDLSEGGYGVSMLNDCKYGHDIHENVIRLTLLRSPSYPDPTADRGHHKFTYSIFPHGSDWKSGTIQAAYELNYPHLTDISPTRAVVDSLLQNSGESFIRVNQPNVVLETIKQAENGNGIIIRLFESQRKRGEIEILTGFELSHAWRVNILEENLEEISVSNSTITYNISPYQILSFRLIPI